MRAWWDEMPETVVAEIGEAGVSLHRLDSPRAPIDTAHIFVTRRADLQQKLDQLQPLLNPSGMIWVSWPKKASKVPTNINENVIRDVALPMRLVDVKVCSVDDIWSGLKLVIRKEHR